MNCSLSLDCVDFVVVGDATAKENKAIGKKNDTPTHSSSGGKQVGSAGELSISHILGTSDMLAGGEDPMLDLTCVLASHSSIILIFVDYFDF